VLFSAREGGPEHPGAVLSMSQVAGSGTSEHTG